MTSSDFSFEFCLHRTEAVPSTSLRYRVQVRVCNSCSTGILFLDSGHNIYIQVSKVTPFVWFFSDNLFDSDFYSNWCFSYFKPLIITKLQSPILSHFLSWVHHLLLNRWLMINFPRIHLHSFLPQNSATSKMFQNSTDCLFSYGPPAPERRLAAEIRSPCKERLWFLFNRVL